MTQNVKFRDVKTSHSRMGDSRGLIRHESIIILSILFLAAGLRLWGISFGLPGLFHADEPIVLNHALAYASGDWNPHFFKIPPLVSYLLFGFLGLYYAAGHWGGFFKDPAAFEQLFYSDPSSFYFLARVIFGLVAGVLTVFFLYRAVRRHFGAERALLAAFFLAVNFLHVSDSHYLYADIPLILLMTAALDFFWSFKSEGGYRGHAACGLWIGAAAAVKYNGLFLAIVYLGMTAGHAEPLSKKTRQYLCAFSAAGLIFLALNPYAVIDAAFFMQELQKQAGSQNGVGVLHHAFYSLPGAMGWPLLLTAFAGIISFFGLPKSEEKTKRLALFLFIAGYYLVLVKAGQPYPRYVLPLIPGLLFFAADFIAGFSRYGKRRFIFLLGVLLLSVFPLTKSVLWCRLMSAKDVRNEAKSWVEQTLPPGSALALDWDFYMPRLRFTAEQLLSKKAAAENSKDFSAAKLRKLDALIQQASDHPSYRLSFLSAQPKSAERFLLASPVVPYDLDRLRKENIQYVGILPGVSQSAARFFYEKIRASGQLIKTFSPYRDGSLEPSDRVAMTGGPFTWSEIIRRRCNGHAIQFYALEKTGVL